MLKLVMRSTRLIKDYIKKTIVPGVLSDIGGFGGLFQINKDNFNNPVLVSSTDGVGTKLKIGFYLDKHDTVGQDCDAMCVNDIICSGAKPLFFLDYLALEKNIPPKVAEIVKGVADGCVLADCTLIGGEGAEMPGFYDINEYDLAGFVVGIVDKNKIIDGTKVKVGDSIIGLESTGLHSNGYLLVRKILEKYPVKAIANITGGGFIENISRMIPKEYGAKIKKGSWPVHPIFKMVQDLGNVKENDMYNTFNMGIGMVIVIDKENSKDVLNLMKNNGEEAFLIGEVVKNNNKVKFY